MEQRLWISASDVFVCSEGDQRPPLRKLGAVIPRSCEVRSDESSLKEMIPPPPSFLKLRTRALEMLLVVALCVCHAARRDKDPGFHSHQSDDIGVSSMRRKTRTSLYKFEGEPGSGMEVNSPLLVRNRLALPGRAIPLRFCSHLSRASEPRSAVTFPTEDTLPRFRCYASDLSD